ncbi:hypothetical protein C6N40_11150 [Arenimonas caeni]|uniref:DUF4124 domain-containing protein n=2 Tax=Arenimonas caeni TaxID=2058085 RepID=A0A2P6M715_9GAMM|nr:hypothetical protein C6N40_11150 [Arenimonas caeni]
MEAVRDRRGAPMKTKLICLAVAAAVFAAGGAMAQEKAKKLYRWVDKDGKVQFSDTLPAEALEHARTEISASSGRTTGEVGRALSPEEQAEADRLAAAQARQQRDEEQLRQTEEAMLASFQTEDDLRRSYGMRITLMQENLNAIEAGIGSQRNSLTSLLAEASEAELAGRAVDARQAATIRELHHEMAKQQNMLVLKQAELMKLDEELEYLVKRFHELRGTGPAAPDAPAAAEEPAGTSPAG